MNITKRLKSITVVIVLILTMLAISTSSIVGAANKTGVVYNITTYLNVRSSASNSASIIGKLYNKDTVTILGTSGSFYKVTFKSSGTTITGYASTSYIKIVDDSSSGSEVVDDSDFEAYMTSQGFPESYKPALRELHAQHPSWIFVAQDVGLKWSTVVSNEMVLGRNLVHKSSLNSWKSMEKGAYNFNTNSYVGLDGSNWVAASNNIVSYYLDPRNFLDDTRIFMFESLSYNTKFHTQSNVEQILKNSFMKGSYKTTDTNKTYTYAKTFMDAAKESGVSPYHLAARALQEQGVNGTSLSTGTVSGFKGYYNFFNIQAYAANGYTAVQNGAKYASTTNAKFSLPWTNQYKSLVGGSTWIGTGYIDKLQDTLYLQKFDVVDGGNGYYAHQYMTNVQAAESEAKIMKKAYTSEMLKSNLVFNIPVYQSMPEKASAKPTSTGDNNNLLNSLSVNGYSITPSFNRYTTTYKLKVPADVSSVTIKATANSSSATVSGIGKKNISVGDNKLSIKCKSSSGLTRTYTLTITRETPTYTLGDVDNNGKININDALIITRYVNGKTTLDSQQLLAADVTKDGKVNINDALKITMFINGKISGF